jgi:hypothetical protein
VSLYDSTTRSLELSATRFPPGGDGQANGTPDRNSGREYTGTAAVVARPTEPL